MTNFEERIARIEELEKKRTQGEWEPVSDLPSYAVATKDTDIVVTRNRQYRAKHELDNLGCRKNDAEFIAMTSTEVSFLLEAVKVMRDKLKKAESNCPGPQAEPPAFYCPGCDAREALKELEEIAGR